MSKNKPLNYDRYVISDLFPIAIMDMDTGDDYPLADEGIFETVCELLNKLNTEKEELKLENKRIEKAKDNWAFIADCSVQVLNEEFEEVKDDYLKVANNQLYDLQKEHEQLKQLLGEAEDIIICQTTPYYQEQWENIKRSYMDE